LEYVDKDGTKKRPVIVHRAIYDSVDRFMATLLEHFRGKLPTWLSPIQVRVLPITEEVDEYANDVTFKLREKGVRVDVDSGEETLSKRIKRAYDEGIPYIVIVGKEEMEKGEITVRARGNVEIRGI